MLIFFNKILPYFSIMTRIELLTLERLKTINPNIQLAIDRLGLDPSIQSPSQRESALISNRVSSWFENFSQPAPDRYIIPDTFSPFDTTAQEAFLISFYGPRPWTYPLTKTPF